MLRIVYSHISRTASDCIYGKIRELVGKGEKCCLIVPESAVLISEQKLFSTLEAKANLYFEILTFKRLPNRIHRQVGGIGNSYINDGGRAILTALALDDNRASLVEYGNVCASEDFVIAVSNKISKFKSMSVSSEVLSSAAQRAKSDGMKHLSDKLFDISTVYSAYEALLKNAGDDAGNRMEYAAKRLSEERIFEGITVFADGFSGYTPQEYEILGEILKQSKDLYVSIPCLPDGDFVFEKPEKCSDMLKRIAAKSTTGVKFEIADDELPEEFELIKNSLWHGKTEEKQDTENVKIYSANGKNGQAEAAAMLILKLCREGMRMRDIAVCAADVSQFDAALSPVFSKHRIPFYSASKTDFDSTQLYKFIMSTLAAVNSNFRCEDVTAMLESSLTDVPKELADTLILYAKAWRINGKIWSSPDIEFTLNPDGYTNRIDERSKKILEDSNRAKSLLCKPIGNLKENIKLCRTVKDYCKVLYEYTEELCIESKLENFAKEADKNGEYRLADLERQLWSAYCGVLDQCVTLCAERSMSLSGFIALLKIAFRSVSFSTIPDSVDTVQFVNASQIACHTPKAMIILGVNEGIFPKPPESDAFFTKEELSVFRNVGIDLGTDAEQYDFEPLREFYAAAIAPSEKLYLLYDSTTPVSVGIERMKSLLGIEVLNADSLEAIGTEAVLDAYAKTHSKEYEAAINAKCPESIRQFDIPLDATNAYIEPKVAKEALQSFKSISPSFIENFSLCKFSCWLDKILSLRVQKEIKIQPNDIGTYTHSVLERFVNEVMINGVGEITPELIREYICKFIEEYTADIFKYMSSRDEYLLSRLKENILMFTENLADEFAQSKFIPWKTEYKITDGIGLKVELDDKSTLGIKGSIDRVDIYRKDGTVYVRIADYKSGGKDFKLDDVEKGLSLQMLMYLFSLCENGEKELGGKPEPAGVLYYPVKPSGIDSAKYGEEVDRDTLKLQYFPNGVLANDADILSAMEANLEKKYIPVGIGKRGKLIGKELMSFEQFDELKEKLKEIIRKSGNELKSGAAAAVPYIDSNHNACDYCDFAPICRIEVDKIE